MKKIIFSVSLIILLAFTIYLDQQRRPINRVVLITLDSARADHLPLFGYPRPTVTRLIQLAEEGFLFEQAYASSPDIDLALKDLSIADIFHWLDTQGFQTAAFSDDEDLPSFHKGLPIQIYPKAITAADMAADWLRTVPYKEKAAVWLHIKAESDESGISKFQKLSPMGPAYMSYLQSSLGLKSSDSIEDILGRVQRHDQRLWLADRAIDRFYNKTLNRDHSAVVFVAGSRGESMALPDDGFRLDQGMIHVPLIVWFSDDRGVGKRIAGSVSLRHLENTIHALVRPISLFSMRTRGKPNFVKALHRKTGWFGSDAIYVRRHQPASALIAGGYKLIHQNKSDALYDLKNDPNEQFDIHSIRPALTKRLRDKLAHFDPQQKP